MERFKLSARDVAFVGVFAALSAIVAEVVPGIPIVGYSGASIKFDASLAPIYGLVIGPYLGFLAGFIGGVVVADNWFSVLTSFCTATSALVAGLLTQKNFRSGGHSIRGWVVAATVLGLLILGWYATWVGQGAPLYPVLHFLGLAIILASRGWLATGFGEDSEKQEKGWTLNSNYIFYGTLIAAFGYVVRLIASLGNLVWNSLSFVWDSFPYLSILLYFVGIVTALYGLFGGRKFVVAVGLASYCGIIADHMLGNLIFIGTMGILVPKFPNPSGLFMMILPISAVERFVLTTIATLIGVSLVFALRRAGFFPRRL